MGRILRSPCFYFAILSAIFFGLQQARVFAPESLGARLLEAGQFACALIAAWFPGLRVQVSPSAVIDLVQHQPPSVQRQVTDSIPPPPPIAKIGPGLALVGLVLFAPGCASVRPELAKLDQVIADAAPKAAACDAAAAPSEQAIGALAAALGQDWVAAAVDLVGRAFCEVWAIVKAVRPQVTAAGPAQALRIGLAASRARAAP